MNRLLEIGFEPAGHWLTEEERLVFRLLRHSSQKNILYAFVCDGQVKYIGKTVRMLSVRMAGYKNPGAGQSTNINNHERIKRLLQEDASVEILALPDNGLLHFGQFHLNLAAALEDDLIRVIAPEWNGGKREETRIEPVPVEIDEVKVRPVDASFSFVLQATYYRCGFFNVSVNYEGLIGSDGETIELFLQDNATPILGTINRRANKNGTPRIMGGTGLRDWFGSEALIGQDMLVDVFSPTALRLRAS